MNFQFFYCCDLENNVKLTKILSILCYVLIIYPWKFGKNPNTGSQDIAQGRKCDADANADTNANRIHTKNNMLFSH